MSSELIDSDDMRRPLRGPGSLPLKSRKEEAYSQQRALGLGQREAAREAGLDDYTGIFAKYEIKPRVRQRIAFLRGQDMTNEYFQAKRRAVEARLNKAAFGNLLAECVDIVDGKPVLNWDKLLVSELAVTISDLKIDKDTGAIVNLGRDNALGALSQLREMHGFKAADHVKLSVGVETLSDEDLMKVIAQPATALPPPDTMTAVDSVNSGDDVESD